MTTGMGPAVPGIPFRGRCDRENRPAQYAGPALAGALSDLLEFVNHREGSVRAESP